MQKSNNHIGAALGTYGDAGPRAGDSGHNRDYVRGTRCVAH